MRLQSYLADENSDKACECPACGWTGPEKSTLAISDLDQRIAPGETVPVGECPECGALCHYTEVEKNTGAALAIAVSGLASLVTQLENDPEDSEDAALAAQGRALLNRLGRMVGPQPPQPGDMIHGRDSLLHPHPSDERRKEKKIPAVERRVMIPTQAEIVYALRRLVDACNAFAPGDVAFEPRDHARDLLARLPVSP